MVAIILQLAVIIGGMKKLAVLLALLLSPVCALGQQGPLQGTSTLGGIPATTQGAQSSNRLQGVIPAAQISIYLAGTTTLATGLTTDGSTPLSNPFYSNASTSVNPGGYIAFAATSQGYDIVGSSGMGVPNCTLAPLCYTQPVTLCKDCFASGGGPFLPINNPTFTGTLTGPNVNGVPSADNQIGSDIGAKINAADAAVGTGPGNFICGAACANATATTPISISAGHTMTLLAGPLLSTHTIAMGANSAIIGVSSASPGPVTIQAAPSAGLSALVTPGTESVLSNLNFDGNSSTLANCGGANGGMASSSSVVDITAARVVLDHATVQCGADANISLSSAAENTYLMNVESLSAVHQGLLCTNRADVFILDGSQFETNGYSGIELNGCAAVQMTTGDISGNGVSGASGTTGASFYDHGTTASLSTQNTLTNVSFGNNYFQDIVHAGWDPVGGGRGAYADTFTGNKFQGSSNRTASTVPSILITDGEGDQIIGGAELPGVKVPTYAVQFTETVSGRSVASTVVGMNFLQGFGTANYISSTLNPNFFYGNIEGNSGLSQLGPRAYIANRQCLYFNDTSGAAHCGIFSDIGNNLEILDEGGGEISLTNSAGVYFATFNANGETLYGALANSHATIIPSTATLPYVGTVCPATFSIPATAILSAGKAEFTQPCANAVVGDNIACDFNGGTDPTTLTGFLPSTSGGLQLFKWVTAGTANFALVNDTGASITPTAFTVNCQVRR